MHGLLYIPEEEVDARRAFVLFRGGSGLRRSCIRLPMIDQDLHGCWPSRIHGCDGDVPRPLPDWRSWKLPVAKRMPIYLFDRELSAGKIQERNLKCTFNTILEGAGLLTDEHLADREILAFGHSTGRGLLPTLLPNRVFWASPAVCPWR